MPPCAPVCPRRAAGEDASVKRDEALVPGKTERDLRTMNTEEGKKPVTKGHTLYGPFIQKARNAQFCRQSTEGRPPGLGTGRGTAGEETLSGMMECSGSFVPFNDVPEFPDE